MDLNLNQCFLLLTIIISCSCKKDPLTHPEETENTNYIPLSHHSTWTYIQKNLTGRDSITEKKVTEKDTIVHGKKYTKISSLNYYDQLIRKEGKHYFTKYLKGAFTDTAETLFMKDNVREGDSWISHEHGGKLLFSVEKIIPIKTIQGKKYSNVAIVRRDIFGYDSIWVTTYHHYANQVGEIYSYLPYPYSMRYEDIELRRVD